MDHEQVRTRKEFTLEYTVTFNDLSLPQEYLKVHREGLLQET